MKKAFFLACIGAVLMDTFVGAQQRPVAGPNVDVIGGPVIKVHPWFGDPGGQRQDEASCFVDSRNPLVVGCAYNDYTPVEIPGSDQDRETGDAWIGQSISTDGGATWIKYLMNGYPQDTSAAGLASPLHGFDAAADPTWRSAPNGVSYLTGIAFNRASVAGTTGAGTNGVLFIQKFVNTNNVENDRVPVKPVGPPIILATGNDGQFQDKPWFGVGADGSVNIVVATFIGGNKPHSTVWFFRSNDGLQTISKSKLSEGDKTSNGTIVAVHPRTGWVDVAWRRRGDLLANQTDAIQFVRSTDGGRSFTSPTTIVSLTNLQRADGSLLPRPFDQGGSTFRNISNPALAVGADGQTYVAWAERIQSNDPNFGLVTRDSHIKLTVGTAAKSSGNQVTWASPQLVDSLTAGTQPLRGQQLRPSLWFASGKLFLSAAFSQEDQTTGVFTRQERQDPGFPTDPTKTVSTYVETREPRGELLPQPPTAFQIGRVFNEFIIDYVPADPTHDVKPAFCPDSTNPACNQVPRLQRRHTENIGVWQATIDPTQLGSYPRFAFAKVTRFGMAFRKSQAYPAGRFEQVEDNVWTLTLHCGGKCAFAGDYDDLVSQAFVAKADGSGYAPNISANDTTPAYVAWTDNRYVRPLVPLTQYFPAGANACSPGADATGTRNQEVMISRVGNGIYAYVLGNQKALNGIQRAFAIVFQNGFNATKHYRASVSVNFASWKQFQAKTSIDISLSPFTTAARELYAQGNFTTPIRIDVVEIDTPGGSPVTGGLRTFTMVNPDATSPPLQTPINDGVADQTNPNAAEIFTPDPTSPDPTSANVDVTPDPTSPDPTSPDPTSPDPTSVSPDFPDPTSPDPTSPDPTSPDPTSPDPTSPDVTSMPPGSALTDTLVHVKNKSNVAAAFAVKTFVTKPLPPGFKLQVLATQPYAIVTQRNCVQKFQPASALVANIPSPALVTSPTPNFDPADASSKEVTVALPPGGETVLVYRLFLPPGSFNPQDSTIDAFGRKHTVSPQFDPSVDVVPLPIAQAVSTPDIPPGCPANPAACPTQGKTVAPGNAVYLTTTALADAIQTQPYSQTLRAIGGIPPYSWSSTPLPNGLVLNASTGVLSGVPTVAGTFAITFTVTDSATPVAHTASRTISLRINPAADVSVAQSDSPDPVVAGGDVTYTITVLNSGPSPATAVMLTDTPPAQATIRSMTPSQGTCSGMTCDLGSLASGSSATVTVVLTPGSPGANTNQAQVSAAQFDQNTANNTSSETTTVIPPPVFVSTFHSHQIVRVDPTTGTSQVIFTGNADPNLGPEFTPEDIVFGPDLKLYVCNSIGNQIWRMDPDGSNAAVIYDARTAVAPNNPIGPEGPSFWGNDLYFNTRGTGTGVWKIADATTTPGAPIHIYATNHFGEGTVFQSDGSLLIVDRTDGNVLRLTQPFDLQTPATTAQVLISGLATGNAVFGIAVDKGGNIFVALDTPAERKVLRYTSQGAFVGDYTSFVDSPSYIEFDAVGELFAVTGQGGDSINANVWLIDASGAKTLINTTPLSAGVGLAVPSRPLPVPPPIL